MRSFSDSINSTYDRGLSSTDVCVEPVESLSVSMFVMSCVFNIVFGIVVVHVFGRF